MSNTEAKAWTSSPGRPGVAAEGCRHAIKIDCGICHAEEFERDMTEVEPVKHESSKLEESIKDIQLSVAGMMSAEDIVYLSDQAAKYKKALEEIDDPCMTVHRAMAIARKALK